MHFLNFENVEAENLEKTHLQEQTIQISKVLTLILQINKSIIKDYWIHYRIIDLSIANRQNYIFISSIMIDFAEKHRTKASVDLNYQLVQILQIVQN